MTNNTIYGQMRPVKRYRRFFCWFFAFYFWEGIPRGIYRLTKPKKSRGPMAAALGWGICLFGEDREVEWVGEISGFVLSLAFKPEYTLEP